VLHLQAATKQKRRSSGHAGLQRREVVGKGMAERSRLLVVTLCWRFGVSTGPLPVLQETPNMKNITGVQELVDALVSGCYVVPAHTCNACSRCYSQRYCQLLQEGLCMEGGATA
jgi:hypothetical protein